MAEGIVQGNPWEKNRDNVDVKGIHGKKCWDDHGRKLCHNPGIWFCWERLRSVVRDFGKRGMWKPDLGMWLGIKGQH